MANAPGVTKKKCLSNNFPKKGIFFCKTSADS